MPAEMWALSSAFFFAASHVVSKRGLQDTSVISGSLVILSVSWVIISISVLFDPPQTVTGSGVAMFAGLGLLVPAISRGATLKGVDLLGPSVAIPIQHGMRPVLAVAAAAWLLGESVGAVRWLGIAAIVVGGWHLSRRPKAALEMPIEPESPVPAGMPGAVASRRSVGARMRGMVRPGIVYPLLAALAYASSDVIVRQALGSLPEPGFAAMVSSGAGLLVWLSAAAFFPAVRRRWKVGRGTWWLALSGALVGLAILGIYNALGRGNVSVVTPINSTQPLMVLVLSSLILRDLERITLATALSGLAIVTGTILVSL